jgi:hypothetical protein
LDFNPLNHSNASVLQFLFMAPKFFYGYVILGLCLVNMVVMRGVNGAFGVYYLALLEEFSWSRSDGATVASSMLSPRRWSAWPSTGSGRGC